MIIDCASCLHSSSLACGDCVVSVLLGMPGEAIGELAYLADDHAVAIGVLADSGLVPPLRLVRRSRAS